MPTKPATTPSETPHVVPPGPAVCRPGKPCALLAMILDQTERLTKSTGGGLFSFVRLVSKPPPGAILSGVIYKASRKSQGYVINHCPWCAQDPSKREPEPKPAPKKATPRRRRA